MPYSCYACIYVIYMVMLDDNSIKVTGNIGLMISMILNLIAYVIFAAFFVRQKFATLKKNFGYFVGFGIGLVVLRIVGEIVGNIVVTNNA